MVQSHIIKNPWKSNKLITAHWEEWVFTGRAKGLTLSGPADSRRAKTDSLVDPAIASTPAPMWPGGCWRQSCWYSMGWDDKPGFQTDVLYAPGTDARAKIRGRHGPSTARLHRLWLHRHATLEACSVATRLSAMQYQLRPDALLVHRSTDQTGEKTVVAGSNPCFALRH